MKKVLKKIDWFQVGVLGLGIAASIAKSFYENKKFDEALNKKFNEKIEKKVDQLIKDGLIKPVKDISKIK